jgi:hypothetical protein
MLIATLRPPEGIDSARSFYGNSYKDLHHRCGFCRHRAHGLRSNRLGVRSRNRVHVKRPGQNVGGRDDRRESQSHDEARQESTEEYRRLYGQWRALFALRRARSDRHLSPRSILTPRIIIAASSVTRPWTNRDLHRGGIGRSSSAIARHVEHAERLPARWGEMFPLGLSRSVPRVW